MITQIHPKSKDEGGILSSPQPAVPPIDRPDASAPSNDAGSSEPCIHVSPGDAQPKKFDPKNIQIPKLKTTEERQYAPQIQTDPPQKPPGGPPTEAAACSPERKSPRNPFRKYSLRGKADQLAASAAATKPLFGTFVMQGQSTMIYAEPNTGKTLIILKLCLDAIAAGSIDPENVVYINADDSSEGLAIKVRLTQDVGADMLAPGHEGLRASDLLKLFVQAIEDGSARGMCVIIDTLKKFTDLMDKKRSSEIADLCRQFVSKGGTVVALGHTTKNPNADGTPRYQGTTDIIEDFDAVYVAQTLTSKANANQRVVKFTRKKSRADSPDTVAYAYTVESGISYEEKLASLRPVRLDELEDYVLENESTIDGPVMEAIARLIQGGSDRGQVELARAAAKECRVSHQAALKVLNRYTGDEPRTHLWNFDTGRHNCRTYRLIDQTRRAD